MPIEENQTLQSFYDRKQDHSMLASLINWDRNATKRKSELDIIKDEEQFEVVYHFLLYEKFIK